jgi:hypothetical protein
VCQGRTAKTFAEPKRAGGCNRDESDAVARHRVNHFIPESRSRKCETGKQIRVLRIRNSRRGSISEHRSLGVLQYGIAGSNVSKGINLQATQQLMDVSYITNTAAAANRTDAVPFSSSISSKPLSRMYRVKAMTALDTKNGELAHHVLPFWFHV